MSWTEPEDWRAAIVGAIDDASRNAPLAVTDPLPDAILAVARELGLQWVALKIWIYDQPNEWHPEKLRAWAHRMDLVEPRNPLRRATL